MHMQLVIDTSVILAVLISEPERDRIIPMTQDTNLLAPQSVHWEVGNALSTMIKRKRITAPQALKALDAYEKIPIRFIETSLHEALSIAAQLDLYAYDAYLIACAKDQRCSLISLDKALLQAARQAGVAVVEVPNT
jgi:predicted nucleic acid-binding protein